MLFYRKPLHTKALILITLLALPMTVFGEWTEIFESDDGSLFYVDHNKLPSSLSKISVHSPKTVIGKASKVMRISALV
jgi:hypothetical protein